MIVLIIICTIPLLILICLAAGLGVNAIGKSVHERKSNRIRNLINKLRI